MTLVLSVGSSTVRDFLCVGSRSCPFFLDFPGFYSAAGQPPHTCFPRVRERDLKLLFFCGVSVFVLI